MRFSLFRVRSPLLTESLLFSLPAGTEMFHFPAFPPHTLCIQMWVTRHHACWVSPFGDPRITARLAAPRGLSQPPTSFIGSWCQGIHRVLLHTYIHKTIKDARVHCAVLKQHTPTPPTLGPTGRGASRESVPSETTTSPTRRPGTRRCCLRHPTVCFVRTPLTPAPDPAT